MMRFTWQNLTRYGDEAMRGLWRHGRAHLWGRDDRRCDPIVSVEWSTELDRRGLTLAKVDVNENESNATLALHVLGIGAHVTVGIPEELLMLLPFRFRAEEYEGQHRSIGVSIHDGAIWWSLWEDTHRGSRSDPKWLRGNLNVVDLVLGRDRYSSEELEKRTVEVKFPEGTYHASAVLERARWQRPRLPRRLATEVKRVRLSFDKPVWMPGKGENDYDQDDDGIEAVTLKANSIGHGVIRFVDQVLNERMARTGSTSPT